MQQGFGELALGKAVNAEASVAKQGLNGAFALSLFMPPKCLAHPRLPLVVIPRDVSSFQKWQGSPQKKL